MAHVIRACLICLLLYPTASVRAADPTPFALRQEYNTLSAQIDSLVRLMETVDPQALDTRRLPPAENGLQLPQDVSIVLIFWADDEARVWINDYPVGETRLTPVEIEIPRLYLRAENRIRARCWDTDWVESGFLFGLYLKSPNGALHPIVVSDRTWKSPSGPARAITYAHPMPDIPGAQVIWQDTVFGIVDFERSFDQSAILQATNQAVPGSPPPTQKTRMDYHSFLQNLVVLQERRDAIKQKLQQVTAQEPGAPAYTSTQKQSLSLTLGKAGPLHEAISNPVAEQVQTWAEKLPEDRKHLIYPDRRKLKGEEAANLATSGATPNTTESGTRLDTYRPPDERQTSSQMGQEENK
ncbi:MAG: hypothetical protein O2954_09830, partial [bacterium]|nr:hypothetical protein [bacterium]